MSITCVALSHDDTKGYTGSKDNSVISWDIETGKKTYLKKYWTSSSSSSSSSHNTSSVAGETLAVAVSYDNKYIASGGRDNIIRIYDPRVPNPEIKALTGHRDIVTCLSFRKDIISASQTPKYSLFSGSMDRTLKHWDLNEMAYIETMFGHQEGVLGLDCWYKNKPISCSNDRTTRIWNVEEESHNVYRSTKITSSIDCVTYISESEFVTGGQDGCLSLYKANLKKPVCKIANAHGYEAINGVTSQATNPRWICSMAALPMSDLLLTGSYDGTIKFWKLDNMNSNAISQSNMNSKQNMDNSKKDKENKEDEEEEDDEENENDDNDNEDIITNNKNKSKDISIKLNNEINNMPGFINGLAVSRNILIAGIGREHRLGRWWNNKEAQNKLFVMNLNSCLDSNNNSSNNNKRNIKNSLYYDLDTQ